MPPYYFTFPRAKKCMKISRAKCFAVIVSSGGLCMLLWWDLAWVWRWRSPSPLPTHSLISVCPIVCQKKKVVIWKGEYYVMKRNRLIWGWAPWRIQRGLINHVVKEVLRSFVPLTWSRCTDSNPKCGFIGPACEMVLCWCDFPCVARPWEDEQGFPWRCLDLSPGRHLDFSS